ELANWLNRYVAPDKGLGIEVTRWETHAYPGMDVNGPQFLVDQVLNIAKCDLFIGIFWKRFGTPVKDAPSGSVHEFNAAYEAWKEKGKPQVWIYFSQQPYAPQSSKEAEQWAGVLRFRETYPEEGLWWTYPSADRFKEVLRDHLIQYLRSLPE